MNISHLSQETLTQLVELAITASPTKAAHILLNNVMVVNAAPIASSKIVQPEISEYEKIRRHELEKGLRCILSLVYSGNRVSAIKELRRISDEGLREAVEIIHLAFPDWYEKRDDTYITESNYWVRALIQFRKDGTVIYD